MNLTPNIQIVDLALLINKDTLIICDIHLGYEESLIHQGYLIPRHQYKDTLERLKKILDKTKPKTIIINGDLKHQFGSILKQEYTDSINFLKFLTKKYKVILIKGNHDRVLDIIAEKVNLKTHSFYNTGSIYIFHGDFIPKDLFFTNSKVIILGHDHPTITLEKNKRSEKFKCFLKGKYKSKTLIIQPSFNNLTIGKNILKEKFQSPLIKESDDLEVYVSEDKVYSFGRINNLISFCK